MGILCTKPPMCVLFIFMRKEEREKMVAKDDDDVVINLPQRMTHSSTLLAINIAQTGHFSLISEEEGLVPRPQIAFSLY